MSVQPICGEICQQWMWFKESNMYLCKIENFPNEENNERSFSNPHLSSIIIAFYGIALGLIKA